MTGSSKQQKKLQQQQELQQLQQQQELQQLQQQQLQQQQQQQQQWQQQQLQQQQWQQQQLQQQQLQQQQLHQQQLQQEQLQQQQEQLPPLPQRPPQPQQLQAEQSYIPSPPRPFAGPEGEGFVTTAAGNTFNPSEPAIPVQRAATIDTASLINNHNIPILNSIQHSNTLPPSSPVVHLDPSFPTQLTQPTTTTTTTTVSNSFTTPGQYTTSAASTYSPGTGTAPPSNTATGPRTETPTWNPSSPLPPRALGDQERSIGRPKSMTVDEYQGFNGTNAIPDAAPAPGTSLPLNGISGNNAAMGLVSAPTSAPASRRNSQDAGRPSEDDIGPSITFVYANEKRFHDFHALFRSVPDDEKLIEEYGCALQKEILVQGRVYISENHVCFNANIFGWVTNVTAIEKRLTAFVIPNAISIVTTTHPKGHFFASFLSRDAAYDLLFAAWRKSYPCAANANISAFNGATASRSRHSRTFDDDDSNDAQSFVSARDSKKNRHRRTTSNTSTVWNGDESHVEDDDADAKSTTTDVRRHVIAPIISDDDHRRSGTPTPKGKKGQGRIRSVSELPPRPASFDVPGQRDSIATARSSLDEESFAGRPRSLTVGSPLAGNGYLSPSMTAAAATTDNAPSSSSVPPVDAAHHSATTCQCGKDGRHYSIQFMSEDYQGTVHSVWKLLFDSTFNKSFLTSETMKGADVQEEGWSKAADGHRTKKSRYTKWLGMPIGPKTTKAMLTDTVEHMDYDEYVTTVTSTHTPDVPSGGSFAVKVRTCITWAGPNLVHVLVTGGVEFTKSSWIKSQIEKGAIDGLHTHYLELDKAIRKYILDHPKALLGSGGRSTSGTSGAKADDATRGPRIEAPLPSSAMGMQQGEYIPVSQDVSRAAGLAPSSSLIESIFSALAKPMDWSQGVTSHFAFMAIMLLVMSANVYIWIKISGLTLQIEKIQSDFHSLDSRQPGVYGPPYQQYHHPYYRPDPADRYPPPHAQSSPKSDFEIGREEEFARDQEDAMWAWLTEREARHQQHRAATGAWVDRVDRKAMPDTREADGHLDPQNGQQRKGVPETEAKLHARIEELQEQLASLECHVSGIKDESQAIEQGMRS
ncbi:hypothetical protein BGZ98_004431 [Dissophora globulifera]|nr:hypothetical protein BGZ98_004431 [Dissophora globulifera]